MTNLSGFEIETHLEKSGRKPWQRPACTHCGQALKRLRLSLPRHEAGELLRQGLLNGEAERLFHSTRDDLGWQLTGWACPACRRFCPLALSHNR
jgi:hypothetical protein